MIAAAVRPRNILGLAAIPAAATLSYLALAGIGGGVPIHLVIALAMTAAGFACLCAGFAKMMLVAPGSTATRATEVP